jgi:CBS domain-containing protein
MGNQAFPTLDQTRWISPAIDIEDRVGGVLDSANSYSSMDLQDAETEIREPKAGKPISSMMQQNVRSVDAEDTIDKVEEILFAHGSSSAPVIGSNGAIVGIIGQQELADFHAARKNAKAVRAWEISRCKMFEVSPHDTLEDVAKLMAENKIEYIAVTELGALKGVVTALDLVQVILREAEQEHARAAQGGLHRRHDD